MANTPVRDGNGSTVYLKSVGSGTDAAPYIQQHVYNTVTADANLTGIVTVSTAGVPVQGTAVTNDGGFFLKAHPDNTDTVWVFDYGQTKAAGFPLNAGETIPMPVDDLSDLGFDADVSGEKVCWVKA